MYADPRLEVQGALPRALGSVLGGAMEGIGAYQARREAAIETGRSRKAKAKVFELKDILRFGDPESETYQKALIELEELEGTPYTHRFQAGPRRAARRVAKGKLPYREARPVPLMGPELGELRGAVTERRTEDWATEQARREAQVPFELSREAITAIGKEPTEVTPRGYGWGAWAEERPGLEKYKAKTGRISALRPRAGGRAEGEEDIRDITTMKKRVDDLWGPEAVGITIPALQSAYGTYFKKVLGARTQDEIDAALERFETQTAKLGKQGIGLSKREIRRRTRRDESLESPAMQSATEDILDTARKAAEEMKRGLEVYGVRGEEERPKGTKKPTYADIIGD